MVCSGGLSARRLLSFQLTIICALLITPAEATFDTSLLREGDQGEVQMGGIETAKESAVKMSTQMKALEDKIANLTANNENLQKKIASMEKATPQQKNEPEWVVAGYSRSDCFSNQHEKDQIVAQMGNGPSNETSGCPKSEGRASRMIFMSPVEKLRLAATLTKTLQLFQNAFTLIGFSSSLMVGRACCQVGYDPTVQWDNNYVKNCCGKTPDVLCDTSTATTRQTTCSRLDAITEIAAWNFQDKKKVSKTQLACEPLKVCHYS
jgi:hypothetical protein